MMDPITDMFNRIKNALAVRQETVEIPFSKMKLKIAEILKKQGFISDFKAKGKGSKKIIKILLKYTEDGASALSNFKRVSKPGQRIYKSVKEMKKVKDGYGIAIISTSKGLMTDKEARKDKIGGEVIVEIW